MKELFETIKNNMKSEFEKRIYKIHGEVNSLKTTDRFFIGNERFLMGKIRGMKEERELTAKEIFKEIEEIEIRVMGFKFELKNQLQIISLKYKYTKT